MFTCTKCGGEFDDALRARPYTQCQPCRKAYKSAYRAQNRERINAQVREWGENNRGYKRQKDAEYKQQNRERLAAYMREYRQRPGKDEQRKGWLTENKTELLKKQYERHKRRMASDPDYRARWNASQKPVQARRRAAFAATLAALFRDDIKAIYDNCPKGHDVDHIWPLKGKNFSGLHVPWNLQYLDREENRRKKNRAPKQSVLAHHEL